MFQSMNMETLQEAPKYVPMPATESASSTSAVLDVLLSADLISTGATEHMDHQWQSHTSMDGSLGMPLGDVSMPSIPWNDISLFPDDLEIPSKGIGMGMPQDQLPFDLDLLPDLTTDCQPLVDIPQNTSNNKCDKGTRTRRGGKQRGPKPRYVYSCPEQAAAARRQRNRNTALKSYYKRREHIQNLEKQVKEIEEENAALCQLLDAVERGLVTIADDQDIDAYLERHSDDDNRHD